MNIITIIIWTLAIIFFLMHFFAEKLNKTRKAKTQDEKVLQGIKKAKKAYLVLGIVLLILGLLSYVAESSHASKIQDEVKMEQQSGDEYPQF